MKLRCELGLAEAAQPAAGNASFWPIVSSATLILALGSLSFFVWLREDRPLPPPVLVDTPFPAFELMDQDGEPFAASQLAGKVWVANFMFTGCTRTCPMQAAKMRLLQEELQEIPEMADAVRLVSFSIDSERDRPDVLRRYSDEYQADNSTWHFLTGSKSEVVELSQQGFKLPAASAGGEAEPTHSDRFALVDAGGRVRGYYLPTEEPGELQRLVHDIRTIVVDR